MSSLWVSLLLDEGAVIHLGGRDKDLFMVIDANCWGVLLWKVTQSTRAGRHWCAFRDPSSASDV
eukprot:286434-Amphidinium_carterae.1